MGLALFKERRLSDRRKLTGLMPGRLMFADGKGDLVCRPVDLSNNGIGVVITGQKKQLAIGEALKLVTEGSEVQLRVAWSKPDFGKQDSTRYGIVTVDPGVDLEDLFISHGCLR